MCLKKITCLALVLVLVAALAAGCTPAAPGGAGSAEVSGGVTAEGTIFGLPRAETFVFGAAEPVRTLNPFMGTGRLTASVVQHITHDVLAWREADGTVVPRMAESWWLVDELTWEFTLRDNIYAHDGERLTAENVKFSFELAMNRPEFAEYQLPHQTGLREVVVIDERTFQLITEQPTNSMEFWLFEAPIIPIGFYTGASDEQMATQSVGFGPYKVVEYVINDRLVLEAFDNYWQGAPDIKHIVIRAIPEEGARINELRAGSVDFVESISLDVADMLNTDISRLDAQPGLRKMALTISIRDGHEALSDRRVRQALNYAVNKESIIENFLGGYTAPLRSYVNPPNNNPALSPYPYDPDRARALLAEAGWAEGLELVIQAPTARYGLDREITMQLAADLEAVGITVTNEFTELGVFLDRLDAFELTDLVWIGWAALINPVIENLILTGGHTDNSATWANPEFDALFAQLSTTMDPTELQRINFQMQEIAWEEAPWIWLWHLPQVVGVSNRIEWNIRNDGYYDIMNARIVG